MTYFSFETDGIALPQGAWAKTHRRTLCWQGKELFACTQGAFRPYLYPVFSPAGFMITTESPADHPHHNSLWIGTDHLHVRMPVSGDLYEEYTYCFYVDQTFQGRSPGRILETAIEGTEKSSTHYCIVQTNEWRSPDEWAADDLIQETFVRTRQSLRTIRDPAKISSWIYRTAYNLCQDHFRSLKKTALNANAERQPFEVIQEVFVEKELQQHQMGTCVQDQMNLLPETYRTVLVLYDVLDFNQKEIAEILDITVENVKVRLHRARKKFKVILEEKCSFEHDERDVLICEPK